MSTVLVNLAMAVGFLLCLLSFAVGLLRGVPLWTALFRSAIVLSIGTVVVMAFFRYFNVVLYRFLEQKIREHREKAEAAELAEGAEE
ncbi:MAG: hypothetical protein JXR25_04700 [Pontiellaceae bacterium]|nr:hypothetical protein [Pontiellaceae bacterium]MBN2784105.1 hypothetical protein [Pontiellaceae bacterium]